MSLLQPNLTPQTQEQKFLFHIIQAIQCLSGGGGAALATEATLQSVLTAIQNTQDFEVKLVRDTGNGDKVVCERIEYDETTDTYTYSYVDVGGIAYVPTGPLEYLDPDAVLNLVLAELISQTATLGLIEGDTDLLSTPETGLTPGLLRSNGVGASSVAAGARRVSFFNAGNTDASVAGSILERGELVTYSADGLRDVLGSIAYDDMSTTLLISEVR